MTLLKPVIFIFIFIFISNKVYSYDIQNDSTKAPKKITFKDVQSRSRDHLILESGYMNWLNKPDSINIQGFNRQFKFYGMYDFLIKGFPYMSIGLGLGLAWDNVYFGGSYIDLTNTNKTNQISFNSSKYKYDKNKITTFYGEIPVELRFTTNPRNYNRGFKASIGISYGLLLQAYSKGVKLYENDVLIDDSKYVVKNSTFFNTSRIVATVKIGWGIFHLYGTYQIDKLFGSNQGPDVQPYAFGIGISGL